MIAMVKLALARLCIGRTSIPEPAPWWNSSAEGPSCISADLCETYSNCERMSSYASLGSFICVLALLAGVFGFGGLAGDFSSIARILLFVFIVLFVVSLIMGGRGRAVV